MRRLWVRLTLLFSSIVLVAAAVIILIGLLITQESVIRYILSTLIERPGAIIDRLNAYYEDNENSWEGVGNVLDFKLAEHFGPDTPAFVRDLNGNEFQLRPDEGQPLEDTSFPINRDNTLKGYLVVQYPAPDYSEFLTQFSRIMLFIAFIGTIIGLIYAVFVSRSLTAPLTRLSDAAKAIGARNLTARVQPQGSYEMVELANSFNRMAADLERGEALRRDMLADTAHELRTPLSVLMGNLRAILDDVYPLDKAEVARLYEQSRLLNRLVNDLHELAQAEARQLPMSRQPTDVKALVEALLQDFEPLAEEEGLKLHAEYSPNLPLVTMDKLRMAQVINNLLANALRHTSSGGILSVLVGRSDDHVTITVRDNGEGIAPADLPNVFNRFYRSDRARARSTGGSGLGLAIAKAIVEAHDGSIRVESTLGQGATFTISLPLT
jgi:signal transduction histidine kinase